MKKLLLSIFFFLISSVAVYSVSAASSLPSPTGYVNDFANVLSSQFVTQLNTELKNFDQRTTNQIVVVTVKSTEPDPIEDYSIKLAEAWKPGQKGKDNGVIMLFAMQDRKMRIEVGRGLEGELTDIKTKHIQDDFIVPEFKNGNYEKGIQQGVDAVIKTIDTGGTVPQAQNSSGVDFPSVIIILFIIFIFIAISPHTPLGGSGAWGVGTVWGPMGTDDKGGNSGGGSGFGGGGGSFSGGGSSSGW